MKQRINLQEKGQSAIKSLFAVGGYLAKSSLDKSLLELMYFRVSQINGCAFCLDMHSKDLLAKGESAQRLFVMDAWRETPFFSERERAALAWAEAVTKIVNGEVSDEVYEAAKQEFSEEELIDLTLAVATINTWNRLNIAFHPVVGTYQVGKYS
jgi:AhpD family alkylhydroperoxidase